MKRDENVQPTRKKIRNLNLMPGFMISLLPLLLVKKIGSNYGHVWFSLSHFFLVTENSFFRNT